MHVSSEKPCRYLEWQPNAAEVCQMPQCYILPPKIRCDAVLKFTVLDSFVACNPETSRLHCCPSWHIRVSQRERQWAVAKSVTLMSCVSQQHPTHCSLDLQYTLAHHSLYLTSTHLPLSMPHFTLLIFNKKPDIPLGLMQV